MSELQELLNRIEGLGVDGLRAIWRERLGEPPPVRAPDILRRALAEELQLSTLSRDTDLDRQLGKLVARHKAGRKPKVATASYKTGSTLTRDWQGQRYRVEVVQGGYIWNGEKHASLSKIAREITGVRWNGPRFFGLREETVR
jgi:hypothetical protein